MQVKKAVITAAGRGVRQYPASDTVQKAMLPLVDRDGLTKPIIQIIAEEALAAGIEEICVVTAPGDTDKYRMHFKNLNENLLAAYKDTEWALEQSNRLADLQKRLTFSEQTNPEGYGHAVWCAKEFVGDEPFLLLLGDHLYISGEDRRCASQVIELARQENASVSAVQATREHLIYQYGTVYGKRLPGKSNIYQIEDIVEKPNPSLAETRLHVPGLRVGYYLCFFGMHVLTPTIFDILDSNIKDNSRLGGEIQLTPALLELAKAEKYLATETRGRRYDVGVKYGFLEAQIALGLSGIDKDKMLSHLTELLLNRELDS